MTDNKKEKDFDTQLDAALERHNLKELNAAEKLAKKESNNAISRAFRIGVELVSGLIVGCGFGLLIDHYFDTSPIGIIVFFFLGCATGMLNVYKSLQGLGYKVGYEAEEKQENNKN